MNKSRGDFFSQTLIVSVLKNVLLFFLYFISNLISIYCNFMKNKFTFFVKILVKKWITNEFFTNTLLTEFPQKQKTKTGLI